MLVIVFVISALLGYLIGYMERTLKEKDEEIAELKEEKEEVKTHSTSNFADPLAGYKKIVDKDSKLYVPVKDKTGRRRRSEQRIEIGEDDRF